MKNSTQIKEVLNSFLGHTVQVQNDALAQMDGKRVQINFAGILEVDADTPDQYYVRVGEDYYAGPMGVGFHINNVLEAETTRGGSDRITLR